MFRVLSSEFKKTNVVYLINEHTFMSALKSIIISVIITYANGVFQNSQNYPWSMQL